MSLYTETGAINVVSNDTTKGRYSPTGALRINLVSGTAYTGLYADDGALNVVDVSGVSSSTYGGLYHPCGAIRARTALDTFTGLYAPDGSYYFNGLFSPLNLFANGEQGVWYDPSDMTTLFQDSAGTTPVTAVEQPVGLMLDKSKGLVLGPELVSNPGPFSNTTGYTADPSATIVVSGINLRTSRATTGSVGYFGPFTTVVGRTYKIATSKTTVTGDIFIFKSDSGTASTNPVFTENGYFVATATSTFLRFFSNSVTSVVDWASISVRELPGNHASQSTSASRPVLSARVNLLTHTEAFDNAAWVKLNATVTANAAVAPDGTMTADKLVENTTTTAHLARQNIAFPNGAISATWVIKAAERTQAFLRLESGAAFGNRFDAIVDLSNGSTVTATNFGTFTGSLTSVGLGDGWFRFSFNGNTGVRGGDGSIFYTIGSALSGAQSYLGDGTSGIYIWGADLRVTNVGVNLPAYQRVGAATYGVTNPSVVIGNPDYDTNGFPMYLKFDGTDDSMATSTINPGSVDKAQVFAGVRKLSDAAQAIVVESSVTVGTNAGTFNAQAPGPSTEQFRFVSGGSNPAVGRAAVTSGHAAPVTRVMTGLADIAGDVATLRLNGAQVGQGTADQGTGNFGNYPLYIGSRAGTSLRFNGHLYSLIARFGANLPDATIAQTETWVAGKTGIPIVASSGLIWDATADTYISNPYIGYGV